ncbi:hypothetical protein LSCM1_01396 [Leishmania martiniquensis]|uniref:Uncharacterized protein n=1 Tax=Leishmania martiniquensis TaxID=1580590 RepID=A0A836GP34_9TRYP|nr:hypothetical protein LSCM1_01396 [Leishmania martiniquensis]
MYRSGGLSKKSHTEAFEAAEHTPEPTPAPTVRAMCAAPQAKDHTETVRMKEKITAPFMVYDVQGRRIVPNREYDRTLTAELHRVQSILLTRLRTPIQAHLSYTPKELLYELEAALYYVCASLAVLDDVSPLRYVRSDSEADPLMPQLESFLAHHNAPAKAVVALAQCVCEGASHDVLASYLHLLEQRVQQESDPTVDRKRSEDERRALLATKNNVQDMAQLVRDLQTAYRSIDTASQTQRRQPQSDPTEVDMPRSPAANAVPARIVEESFYRVLRWVVAVDADRRSLRAAATGTATTHGAAPAVATAPAPAATQLTANLHAFVRVVEYDPFTGQLVLERADATQRWGLLLNSRGLLVGVENELRNSSEAGERFYAAIQQQSGEAGGLAIFEVNRHRIRAVHMSDEEVAASGDDIMRKLRAALTQATKTLYLTIERRKQVDLTVPREVLFEVSYQGGEGGVGQRCLLMMERAATSISWGLKLKYLKGAPAVLSDVAPSMKLSNAAKNFLFDMRGRLRLLKINNEDMAKLSAAEMKSLISGSLLLTLHLQVTDAMGDVPPKAEAPLPPQVEPPPSAEGVAEAPAIPGRSTVAPEAEVEAATLADAEAAAEEESGPEKVMDSAQAELDDVAASLADEFLRQHVQKGELEAKSSDRADERAMEEADVAAVEPFEELECAEPTTTMGVSGYAHDRQEERDATLEESPEQQYFEEDDGVRDAATGLTNEDAADNALKEGGTAIADAEETAVERETADDATAAEQAAKDSIEAADDDVEADSRKKTRGRKKAPAKKVKASTKTARKGGRGGPREKNGEKGAEEEDPEANDDEGEAAQEAAGEAERQLEGMEDGEAAEASLGDAELMEEAEALQTKAAADDAAVEDAEAETKAASGTEGRSRAWTELRKERGTSSTESASEAASDEQEKRDADAEEAAGDRGPEHSGGRTASALVDRPLVDLPPTTAEVAIKHGRRGDKTQRSQSAKAKGTASEAGEEDGGGHSCDDAPGELDKTSKDTEAALAAAADEDDVSRVSLNELLKAKPLTFENKVRLEKFDGSTLELERSSTKQPWNIKVAFAGDDIIMTKLPPFAPKQRKHPYLRSLGAGPQGEVKWVVDGLNGEDLSAMTKLKKSKALDAIKGTTKLSFVLRALRR